MAKAPRRRPAWRGMLGKEAIHPGRPRNSTGRRAYYWRRRLTPAIQAPPDDSSSGLSSAQCREAHRRSSGGDPTARAPDEGTCGGAKTPRRRAVPRTVTGRATEAGSIYNRPYTTKPRPPPSSRPRPRRRSSSRRRSRRAGSPAGTRRRRRARTPGSGSSSP